MPAVVDTLEIWNAANTAPLATFTMSELSAVLRGDGTEINPIAGELRSGAYVARLVDRVTGGAGVRAFTQHLTDLSGRWQVLSRRAIARRSENGGPARVLFAGYVTGARYVSAIEVEVSMGDRLRVPGTARAFGSAPGFSVNRGCLLGGPALEPWGPVPALGGWLGEIVRVNATSRVVQVRCRRGYGPPQHAWTDRPATFATDLNARVRADLYDAPLRVVALGAASTTGLVDAIAARLTAVTAGTVWTGVPGAIANFSPDDPLTLFPTNGREVTLTIGVDGTGALPALGVTVRAELVHRRLTAQCPAYIDAPAFAFALAQLQAVGIPCDAAAFAAADVAVGGLRLARRLTEDVSLSALLTESILAPLGYELLTDDQGRLFPQRVRVGLADLASVATITDALLDGEPTELWRLQEDSAVARYSWSMDQYVYGASTQNLDGIAVQRRRQEFEVGDLATYATRTLSIAATGMLRPATAWDAAIEQLSARDRGVLYQRYARGAAQHRLRVLRAAATDPIQLGRIVTLAIDALPNGDRRHRETTRPGRLCQVMSVTEEVASRELLLEDIGPAAIALAVLPVLSIVQDPLRPRTATQTSVVNATALNAATLGVELQYAITSGAAPAAGDWITAHTTRDGEIPTGVAFTTFTFLAGAVVWARGRTTQLDRPPSPWSTPVSVALSAVPGVTGLAAAAVAGDGTRLTITWTRAVVDGAQLEVRVRQASDPVGTLRWTQLYPIDSTRAEATELAPGTSHVVEVRAVDRGAVSAWASVTVSTAGASPLLAAPIEGVAYAQVDGVYGLRARVTDTPLPALECEEARETAIGSGSYGPFEGTVQLVPTASGEATLVRAAANDGLRRRQRVRAVRGPVASSWVVVSPDVQPFTDVPLPPSTGIPGDSVEIQYGPTATGPWDSDFTPGVDVFRRERVGTGPWSTPQRIVGLDGAPGTPGTPGTPGASVETQYGPTATGPWDSDFTPGVDLFMRQRVGTGPWSAGIRIVGEQGPPGADGDPGTPGTPGAPGNYFDFRFRRAASQPATPTGNTPAGWDDAPPAGTEPLWFIRGEKTAAGALIGTWSTPVRLSGEGAGNGDPIFLGLGALANYSTSVIEVGYGFRSDIAAAAPTITVTYRVRSTGQGVPIGAPNTPQTISGGPTGVTINAAYIDVTGQFNAEMVMTVSVAVNGVTLTSEFTGAQFLWG